MRLVNHVRVRIAAAVALALASLLASCATNPPSAPYIRMLTGSANPVGVQTGRLMVVAYDSADGGPLMNATVDIVSADESVLEPHYYRRVDKSDWRGTVLFIEVPRLVNISISHARGSYARDNYVVPQGQSSEFRVYVDTLGPRTKDECLGIQLCGR
ncbi:MAG: hypothetical protein ABI645_17810 [Pseudomonadota bacterium]